MLVFILLCVTTTFVQGYVAREKGVIPEFDSIPQLISNGDKCQPLTIPMCKRLGYNSTSAKSNMYSNRLTGGDVQKYLSYFENEICFEDLVFFVCALFNPICFENHDIPILPCKSACRSAKKECQGTLDRFHRNWPLKLECDDLPDYKTGICITRRSIVTKHRKFYSFILILYHFLVYLFIRSSIFLVRPFIFSHSKLCYIFLIDISDIPRCN